MFKRNRNRQKKGVYAFIDSQNLNRGVQKAGFKLDWKKFNQYLQKEHGVTKAYMFIGYMQEHEDMYHQLHDQGFLIVLKPTVTMPSNGDNSNKDDDNKTVVKGNIDAELVLYAMKELPNYDQAIIVSGDGDFYCLAEYLAQKGRLKNILTPNYQYSTLLKPYEDKIIRIDQLRKQLRYPDFRKKKTNPKKR